MSAAVIQSDLEAPFSKYLDVDDVSGAVKSASTQYRLGVGADHDRRSWRKPTWTHSV